MDMGRGHGRRPATRTTLAATLGVALLVPLATLAVPATAHAAAGGDLMANGSFERGATGWSTGGRAQHLRVVRGGHAGVHAAVLSRASRGPAQLRPSTGGICAAAGNAYRVSAWLRTNRPRLVGRLRVSRTSGASATTRAQRFALGARRWTRVALDVTVTAPGTALGVSVLGRGVGPHRWLLVDAVRVTPLAGTPDVRGSAPLLGVYNGGPATDEATRASFGRYPDLASTYYQGNQTINVAAEAARISKGIEPLITITSKSSGYTLAQIGSGAADAWINRYATAAATLDAPLLITLDHEFEVKLNQHQFGTAGPPTIADYATALTRFAARVHAAAPKARVGYWFGGYDKTKIDAVGTALAARNAGIDWYAYDPYSTDTHSAAETFEQTVTPTYTWLHARPWYHAQPSYLGEFGDDLAHGDTSVAGYMSNLRQHLANVGLAGGLLFNRNKTDADGQAVRYKIDTGTSPLSRTAFSTSLASR